jgi:hypothetical protein
MSHPQFQGYLNPIPDILGPARGRASRREKHAERVHNIFGVIGLVVGLAGAAAAVVLTGSWFLGAFVLLLALSYIGRGAGDLVTDPNKVQRFVYFTLQPALCVGLLVVAYQLWERMWLATLLGYLVGSLLWVIVATLAFPKVTTEEAADTDERRRKVRRR